MLQGEMGLDGAKGERGELGMTVSGEPSDHPHSEEADNKPQTHTLSCWRPVFHFAQFYIFILNSGGWSPTVRPLGDESALRWVFKAASVANSEQYCPWVELLTVMGTREWAAQLSCVIQKQRCFLNWPLVLSVCVCLSVRPSACGGEWAIQLQPNTEGGD